MDGSGPGDGDGQKQDKTRDENTSPVEASESFYKDNELDAGDESEDDADDSDSISWVASEFIAHQKSATWYISVVLCAVVLAAIVFLLTRDKISTIVIIVAGIALTIYGARQPRQLQYVLNHHSLQIANRSFPFHDFRSFAVLDEGPLKSIVFMPLKRFGQLVTIYFEPEDESRIVDMLASSLPLEHKTHDLVDQFLRRIRF